MKLGEIHAQWMADTLGGKGNVVINRGVSGFPADTNLNQGTRNVLDKYPDIKMVGEVYGKWDNAVSQQELTKVLTANPTGRRHPQPVRHLWRPAGTDQPEPSADRHDRTGREWLAHRHAEVQGQGAEGRVGRRPVGHRRLCAEDRLSTSSTAKAPAEKHIAVPVPIVTTDDLKEGVNVFPDLSPTLDADTDIPGANLGLTIEDGVAQVTAAQLNRRAECRASLSGVDLLRYNRRHRRVTGDVEQRPAMLRLSEIDKSYGATQAVKSVSLEAVSGTVLGLVGENGAGKSTLIKIVGGVITPDRGAAVASTAGRSRRATPMQALALGIASVFQELTLVRELDGRTESPAHPFAGDAMAQHRSPPHTRHGRQKSWPATALDIAPRARVGDLPLGQQQMLEIVRAVERQPARPAARRSDFGAWGRRRSNGWPALVDAAAAAMARSSFSSRTAGTRSCISATASPFCATAN